MNLFATIQNDIIEGMVNQALLKIKEVLVISDNELCNEAVILLSSNNKLKSQIRKGVIDHKDEELQRNKIIDRTLSLLDEIKEDKEIIEKYNRALQKIELANKRKNIIFNDHLADSLVRRLSNFKLNYSDVEYSILRIGKTLEDFDEFEAEILRYIGIEIEYAYTSAES